MADIDNRLFIELLMPTTHAQHYGTTEGPLGFPLTERQAIALDAIIKALPKTDEFRYRKATTARSPSELLPGERTDVSWITTENPDRTREIVLAKGMNDSQFKLNPIVTLGHAYWMPPVGKSLWRKAVRDGELAGVKAKTQYPVKPDSWQGNWPADIALSLVQADLLRGKSIGFLPTKVHTATDKDYQAANSKDVDIVIDEWILLEYACTFLPAQQNAVVEAVSKSLVVLPEEFIKAMGLDPAIFKPSTETPPKPPMITRFTPLEEIEKNIFRQVDSFNLKALVEKTAKEVLDKRMGRI